MIKLLSSLKRLGWVNVSGDRKAPEQDIQFGANFFFESWWVFNCRRHAPGHPLIWMVQKK